MQREKRGGGGAMKTGKKREQEKQQHPEAPVQLFNVCPSEVACSVKARVCSFFFTTIVPKPGTQGTLQKMGVSCHHVQEKPALNNYPR